MKKPTLIQIVGNTGGGESVFLTIDFLIVLVIPKSIYVFVYVYTDHRNQQLQLMLLLKKRKTVQWNKYSINIYLIVNSFQAPTWTSVRLQPQEHQLCFSKATILDLGAPTLKDFNPIQFWGSNLFGMHWCAAALFF